MDTSRRTHHGTATRVLHLLLAAAVVCQLADTQVMEVPRPGRTVSDTGASAFTLHQYVGLATMLVIVSFWLWLLVRRMETDAGALLPWFSRARLRALVADVKAHLEAARRLRLPDPDRSPALAPAVQGLGLLIALVMAATGTVGYLTWTPGERMTGIAGTVFDVHGLLANALWGYVIVHVGATLLHELLGHRLLRRMVPLAGGEVTPGL